MMTEDIRFPEASTLVFENLPSLVSFCSDDLTVGWPSLEDVTVTNCPNIKMFGLGHVDASQLKSVGSDIMATRLFQISDRLSNINELEIEDAEELNKILAMNLKPPHFTNLVRLQAKNCDGRLNDFLSILLERSEQLKHITIKECKLLNHVFDLNGLVTELDKKGNGKYFARLKTMILWDLPWLTCIWNRDPTGLLGLGQLENLEIVKCSSLKNIISDSAARNLQQLRVLRLHSCEMVEEVVAIETKRMETKRWVIGFPLLAELELIDLSNLINFHRGNCAVEFPSLNCLRIKHCPQMMSFMTGFASSDELSMPDESFTKLSELELDSCGKLKYVIPSIMLPRLQNLKRLTLSHCDSLTELVQYHGEFYSAVPMLPQLSELLLSHLPNLMHVISMEFATTKFFENLEILRVEDCNTLKYLFLPFVADSLILREIEISDCEALEEIFVTKAEEERGKNLFSRLNSIALVNLPKLSTFSLCSFEFPSLEILQITNCPALTTFESQFPEMKNLPAASDNFFRNFKSFVNLKKLLIINQCGVEKLWHNQHPSKSNYELEVLTLNKSINLLNVIPSSMLIRFNKLKSFTVEGCEQLMEVFDLEDLPDLDATVILPALTEFALICLPSLNHVWNKEPHVPVFQNLASLQIIECDSLKSLFSLSTTKHLQQLKLLKLYGCKNMEEVFVDEKGEAAEVVFPKVEFLILKHLPSLVCFCRQISTFKWPELRIVRVSGIPKMETFSQGNQVTPLLKSVHLTFIKKCWQGDLNSTVQYIHNGSVDVQSHREGTTGGPPAK